MTIVCNRDVTMRIKTDPETIEIAVTTFLLAYIETSWISRNISVFVDAPN